jgi:hypothetical protein
MSLQPFSQHMEMDLLGQKSLIIFMCAKLKFVNKKFIFLSLQNVSQYFQSQFNLKVETYTELADVLLLSSLPLCGLSERTLQKSICHGSKNWIHMQNGG